MESLLQLGAHLKISSGFGGVFRQADIINANVIQIFLKSNRSWINPAYNQARITEFQIAKSQSRVKLVIAHAGYLINLASSKKDILNKSIIALEDELQCCKQLNIPYLVVHPGSCTTMTREIGITQISASLNEVFKQTDDSPLLLLENMAGQGNTMGITFDELAAIVAGVNKKNRLGFCLDTSHLFAMGYDFSTEKKLDELLDSFDKACGLSNLKVVHLNDSKADFASRKDRHETIGKGKIGLASLQRIIQNKKMQHVAFVLETPVDKSSDGYLIYRKEISNLLQK